MSVAPLIQFVVASILLGVGCLMSVNGRVGVEIYEEETGIHQNGLEWFWAARTPVFITWTCGADASGPCITPKPVTLQPSPYTLNPGTHVA